MEAACLQIYSFAMERPELDWGRVILQNNGGRSPTEHSNSEWKPMGHRQNPTNSSGNRILQVLDWSVGFGSWRNLPMVWWRHEPTCKLYKVSNHSNVNKPRWWLLARIVAILDCSTHRPWELCCFYAARIDISRQEKNSDCFTVLRKPDKRSP